jgi:hypothetical protein
MSYALHYKYIYKKYELRIIFAAIKSLSVPKGSDGIGPIWK